MTSFRVGLLAASACVALAGCHFPWTGGGAKAPTGQVVATIDGREVTVRDLQVELGTATFADAKTRKAAEMLALRNIVTRIVLANAAHEQGLDKTPDFAVQKARAMDSVLAQTLQQKIISDVPQPSKDEVQSYMNAHSDIFLERKVFAVDQLRMKRPSDPAVFKALEPLKTLEQIQDVLKAQGVPFQRAVGTFDTVGADPRLVEKIVKMPPGEIFAIPAGDSILLNQVRDTKVVPFTGEQAASYAQKLITHQRTQEAIDRTAAGIMAKAGPKIRFNKDYAPQKPSGAPAAPPPSAAGQPAKAATNP